MSVNLITIRSQTPLDTVDLILYSRKDQPQYEFYLRVPLWFIVNHYVFPIKFLRYIAWCVLGRLGDILDEQKEVVSFETETLEGGKTYYYNPDDKEDIFQYAVDIHAIRSEHFSVSGRTPRDTDFAPTLKIRDAACIFTGTPFWKAVRIVPHSKGNDWLRIILENSPYDKPEENLIDVDDIRNGMLALEAINRLFGSKQAIVIKTPNFLLEQTDVASRATRAARNNTAYPDDMRFTFQYLYEEDDEIALHYMPHNNDAMFSTTPQSSALPRPSALLLNYNFGVAAVERWGRNKGYFVDRVGVKHPEEEEEEEGENKCGGSGKGKGDDNGEEPDAEDIVLFFWGNSKAARERRQHAEHNVTKSVEDWKRSLIVE